MTIYEQIEAIEHQLADLKASVKPPMTLLEQEVHLRQVGDAFEAKLRTNLAIADALMKAGGWLSPSRLAEAVFGTSSKTTRARVMEAVQGVPTHFRVVGELRSKKVVLI